MRRRRDSGRFDIAPVLAHYGLERDFEPNYREYGWFAVHCPFHDDSRASARMTLEDGGAFKCHGCGVQGDAISLIIERGDAHDFASAVDFYADTIGGSVPEVRGRTGRKRRRELFAEPRDYERGSSLFSSRLRRAPGNRP